MLITPLPGSPKPECESLKIEGIQEIILTEIKFIPEAISSGDVSLYYPDDVGISFSFIDDHVLIIQQI